MSILRVGSASLALCATMAAPFVVWAGAVAETAQHYCPSDAPAMLVRITGFKVRSGTVRVQSYGGDPSTFFDKGTYLRRIETQVPAAGALDVCMPVPAPGRYAVSVRHDLDGSGRANSSDGGGMSGNPHMSLLDIMLKRKPSPEETAVEVGRGVTLVPITLNYVAGGSFRPVSG